MGFRRSARRLRGFGPVKACSLFLVNSLQPPGRLSRNLVEAASWESV